MKNLKVSVALKKIISSLNCEFVISGKTILNPDTKTLERELFIFQEDTLYLITFIGGIKSKYSVTDLFPCNVPTVKGMLYLDICDVLYSFHQTGEVLAFRRDTDLLTLKAEYFTNIDGEINTLEYSLDKELCAYINNKNILKLIVITSSDFDIIYEYDLSDTSKGEQELINIGWGKKETQFQGLDGKNAATRKIESYLNETFYNKCTYISWRGDSTMFAVGYFCNNSKKRRIKIFSRDGLLLCMNEDIAGLDGPMSWKPQGNLVAFSQQLPNKYVIAFMEKNGLKHTDFALPNGFKVKQLSWNNSSNILCMVVVRDNKTNYLMLWTCGNYHWYLKQMYSYNFDLLKIFWDEDRDNKLYIIGKNGTFYDMEFTWTVHHSNYDSSINKYYVSVIDNDKVLLTPFHSAIIPPPMCKWTLNCPATVNKILYPSRFEQELCKYFMCAILNDGRFCFFSEDSGELNLTRIDESLSNVLSSELSIYHWAWVNITTLICVTIFEGNCSEIVNIQIEEDQLIVMNRVQLYQQVVTAIVTSSETVNIFLLDGRFVEFNTKLNSMSTVQDCFPESCYDIATNSKNIFGLNEWNRLFKNETLIASNVTSFLLHYPFILATTTNHTLLIFKQDNFEQVEEVSIRKLERGSKLIAVTGNTVIMQLPRGNLETIQPRALTIMSVGLLLDKQLYREALYLLRRQRICFDLSIDHNPIEFFKNIKHFVQVVDPQWITLLVTELVPSDVTTEIYSSYYTQKRELIYGPEQKINKICNALLEVLLKNNDKEKYMMATLSCLVKTKNIAKAIELANSEQYLQHLLFLVDVDSLYREALGAYNLEAALKIAGKSQMDPKEYIPFLNSLREMDNNFMKYKIDIMLNRNSSALKHLSNCSDDKSYLMYNLIEEFQLYSLALTLFENQPERFAKTAFMYGEYLYKRANFEESGIMFLRGNNLQKAINSFIKSGNWRQCILLGKKCKFSIDEMKSLGDSVCNTLISSHKFNDAAIMYKDCFGDIDKAVDLYLQGHHWNEALFLAANSGKQCTIETTIKSKVLDIANTLIEELTNTMFKMTSFILRLKQVRLDKLGKPKFRDIDEMSDTSSVSSRSHQSSASKSSRMTKKMSRKMWSLKEGNPREEEALIATLSQMMVNSEKIIGEVKMLSVILLQLKCDELGKILHGTTKKYLKVIEDGKVTIWPKDHNEDETIILDAKFKYPPDLNIDPRWELDVFKD